ncbi:MAG TPA: hypothetical protein VLX92_02925 [Kofleriaceae bacterium]|nr:hypothetical protein [Kofleriaceae bacterium]
MRWALIALAACAPTASDQLGLDSPLYVDGAQFRPGRMPAATGGPDALSLTTDHVTVTIDTNRELMSGLLDPAAHAAIVGIVGEDGTWIVPASPPDTDAPEDASLHATYGIGDTLPPGPFTLAMAAVDADGKIGDAITTDLVAASAPEPDGALVVSLDWDGAADLDLHVTDPAGDDVWIGDPNSVQPPQPGEPQDPCAWATGGILDHDANASCARDGAPAEHVVWTARKCTDASGMTMTYQPVIAPGTYTVRVDARSLCGDADEAWAVTVLQQGTPIAEARGITTPDDVAYPQHGPGAGILALTFAQ